MKQLHLKKYISTFAICTLLIGLATSPATANPRNSSYSVNCIVPSTDTVLVSISNAPAGTLKVGYLVEFIGVGGLTAGTVIFPSANSSKASPTNTFQAEYSREFSQTPWRVTAYIYLGLSNKLQRVEPVTVYC